MITTRSILTATLLLASQAFANKHNGMDDLYTTGSDSQSGLQLSSYGSYETTSTAADAAGATSTCTASDVGQPVQSASPYEPSETTMMPGETTVAEALPDESSMPAETTSPVETTAPAETTTPAENTAPAADATSAGEAQTIIHTVTVTADCGCSTVSDAAPPATSEGLTLTAENPSATETAIATATESGAAAAAATHTVIVGGPAGLVYTPEFVMAAVGDKVVFDFLAKNHTVTQSTLDLPCLFKSDGVKSGFRPNPNNTPGLETFEVSVDSLDPMWFFCAQSGHCAQGMVFAINPKDGQMAQFKENAMGNSTATLPSGTGTPINTAQPVFSGAASGLTAQMGSIIGGFAAVIAFAV